MSKRHPSNSTMTQIRKMRKWYDGDGLCRYVVHTRDNTFLHDDDFDTAEGERAVLFTSNHLWPCVLAAYRDEITYGDDGVQILDTWNLHKKGIIFKSSF